MGTESEWKAFEALAAEARQRPARVEKLSYRAPGTMSVTARPARQPDSAEGGSPDGADANAQNIAHSASQTSMITGLEERLRAVEAASAAEIERLRREGREGLEEARRQAEQRGKVTLERSALEIGAALESFRREREEYFAKVEREVVALALAIAARILHREAEFDPMLLGGAVRVALGHLGETTGVRLRCPVDQAERWGDMLRLLPDLRVMPEIVGDPALGIGDCVLEARVGTVDLGVRAQLAEIESGFFDLIDRRSGTSLRVLGSIS
jgi:flagellar assembly protein FliH